MSTSITPRFGMRLAARLIFFPPDWRLQSYSPGAKSGEDKDD
jgi:hypothetical protein